MRTINATFCGCVNTPYKITNFLHLHVIILTQPELIWGRRVDKGLTELPSDRNAGIGLDVLIKYLRRDGSCGSTAGRCASCEKIRRLRGRIELPRVAIPAAGVLLLWEDGGNCSVWGIIIVWTLRHSRTKQGVRPDNTRCNCRYAGSVLLWNHLN